MRSTKNSKKSQGPRRRPARPSQTTVPPVTGDVRFIKKQRYGVTTNAVNAQIKRSDLLNAYLMTTSANVAYSILEGVRVVSLEVWLPANALSGNAIAGEITWLSDQGMPQTEVFVSNSTTIGTHWKGSPPQNSLASFWSSHSSANLTQNMFYLNLPRGTILDVTFECLLQNGSQGAALPSAVATVAAGSVGVLAVRTLDFSAGSNLVTAIGMASIF